VRTRRNGKGFITQEETSKEAPTPYSNVQYAQALARFEER